MDAISILQDSRINAINVLAEMSIGEYADLASEITKNNVFQRRRVGSSKTVYTLLKQDLLRECVIPPIVLALTSEASIFERNNLTGFSLHVAENKHHLVILDGLQRTYTILDMLAELVRAENDAELKRVRNNKIRVEFYVGLNRIGILYRMLTLNTGQTPMSLRQQIEILYLDYIDTKVEGIELLRESDNVTPQKLGQYKFRDVVEGFNSYIDRDELPFEKSDLLENINSLEKLSKENQNTDLFRAFISTWNAFVLKIIELNGPAQLSDEYLGVNGVPFGKTAAEIFMKPQAMSGFGAAIGKMIDSELIVDFAHVSDLVSTIEIDDPEAFLNQINENLNWIKLNAKKIGNAQRSFFQYFFRELLNSDTDSFKKPRVASSNAFRKYQNQNF